MSFNRNKAEAMMMLQETPVFFQGFKSNVASLYSEGWSIDTERNDYMLKTMACLKNKDLMLSGFIDDFEMMREYRQPLIINGVRDARNTVINIQAPIEFHRLEPCLRADSLSSMGSMEMHRLSLYDLLDFEKPQELIIEPAEVQDLLSQIIAKQRPMQKEIRVKDRKEQPKIAKKTEANIISLYEYG